MLAESAAGELIASEIEIRSGRARDLRRGGRARSASAAAGCSSWPSGMGLALGATGTHPWANYLDQRIIDTPHYNRLRAGTRLGRAAQQHLEPARPHRGPRRRPGDRRLRLAARAAAAAARRLRQLALPRPPRHRPAHGPHARSSPAPSRAAAIPEPFGDWDTYADFVDLLERTGLDRRVDPALVERPPAPQLRHRRGADLRRADARRRVVRAGRADRRLHRPDGARLRRARLRRRRRAAARPRDRGEPLAGDPLRAWTARMIDFRARRRGRGAGGARASCSRGPSRRARSSGIEVELPERNGAQRAREALADGAVDRGRSTARRSPRPRATYVALTGRVGLRSAHERRAERRRPEAPPTGDRGRAAEPRAGGAAARSWRRRCGKVRVQDLARCRASSASSTSPHRRIAKEDERDLEQARVGIEAVRGARRPARPRGAAEQVAQRALRSCRCSTRRPAGGERWRRGGAGRRSRGASAAGSGAAARPAAQPAAAAAALDRRLREPDVGASRPPSDKLPRLAAVPGASLKPSRRNRT